MPLNVMFVVPYVPNLIRVRPYNLIRSLAQRGHKVTVLTLWGDEHERQSMQGILPFAHQVTAARLPRWRSMMNVLSALPSRQPLQAAYCWEPSLVRQMRSLLLDEAGHSVFDVVHVEHLRGARYGLDLKRFLQASSKSRRSSPPVVWDSVDSISLLFRQAMVRSRNLFSRGITRFELGRTEKYEAWLLHQFERVTVTSPNDRQALLSLLNGDTRLADAVAENVAVIPNGVDLGYFCPGEAPRDPDTLVLSGKMSYHANVTMALRFFQEVMPLVWNRRPQARVQIVGKDPAREIRALGEHPQVEVTGTVKDLPPYLQAAAVAVAPIAYGAGIQNKVLEAMACETPVVASSQAVSALGIDPGREALVADGPQEMAAAVLQLLDDPAYRQEVGRAGRRYVEAHHTWDGAAARIEKLYSEAIAEQN